MDAVFKRAKTGLSAPPKRRPPGLVNSSKAILPKAVKLNELPPVAALLPSFTTKF
jgi:hypothetical protein